ncbi:DUF300-domain-containing protein, partial [Metschnikowia bicuspidata]
WVVSVSGWSALIASVIIAGLIVQHLRNYRKPFQQRLMIRIQLILPLFALSCYSVLISPSAIVVKFVVEPVREIYEAFVIYTFFSLLIEMLGGDKSIVIMTSGRPPVAHPGILGRCLPALDISDPPTFLAIKRGILQYVWLKPILCFGVLFGEVFGWYDVNDMGVGSWYLWFTVLYNCSVSLSLYCLAVFWKILWTDLKPFHPIGKFVCVKLIIFASYWQGVILAILNFAGVLPGAGRTSENGAANIGVFIQNALLCVELIGFAVGHWFAFSYRPFTISQIPNGRLKFYYAFRDTVGLKDLVVDFRLTFYGDYYKDYKQFDSVEAVIAHPSTNGRMSRLSQGLRYHNDGKQKHWLPQQQNMSPSQSQSLSHKGRGSIQSTSEINAIPDLDKMRHARYATSMNLNDASTKGIFNGTSGGSSPPFSPQLAEMSSRASHEEETEAIGDVVRSLNPDIDYDDENFDEDEHLYLLACAVVNNYKLDQAQVKKLINYPIVDELIGGHLYGYKVKKLRASRLQR